MPDSQESVVLGQCEGGNWPDIYCREEHHISFFRRHSISNTNPPPAVSGPQMNLNCCLKSKTYVRPVSVPTHTKPPVTITVGLSMRVSRMAAAFEENEG